MEILKLDAKVIVIPQNEHEIHIPVGMFYFYNLEDKARCFRSEYGRCVKTLRLIVLLEHLYLLNFCYSRTVLS